jgi:hypothetical protein
MLLKDLVDRLGPCRAEWRLLVWGQIRPYFGNLEPCDETCKLAFRLCHRDAGYRPRTLGGCTSV